MAVKCASSKKVMEDTVSDEARFNEIDFNSKQIK
jgi:hypothetical protein